MDSRPTKQTDKGEIWHGRNLDFGLFMGTDATEHTWILTEKLRAIMVNIQWMRGGQVLYNSTTFVRSFVRSFVLSLALFAVHE